MNKQWYRVAPGVTWVNGARVKPGQRLLLSYAEAQFDLGLARIRRETKRVGSRKGRSND